MAILIQNEITWSGCTVIQAIERVSAELIRVSEIEKAHSTFTSPF